MKISSRMIKALNDQIAMEAYASNYYLSMASWCEVTGYEGGAKLFYQQSNEERQHMLKIIQYLNKISVPGRFHKLNSRQKLSSRLNHFVRLHYQMNNKLQS